MRRTKLILSVILLVVTMSFTAFASEWRQDDKGWWYQNDDGGYPANQWFEIGGKQYYFDGNGYMLANTTTPDGYKVGADGAWIDNDISTTTSYDNTSYQSILDAYTKKLKLATPNLVAEYNTEAANNDNGLTGLSEICTRKISKLAEIETEGVGVMAELYLKSGSGKYSEYEEWAGKLYNVYSDEIQKIWDVYMDSAV